MWKFIIPQNGQSFQILRKLYLDEFDYTNIDELINNYYTYIIYSIFIYLFFIINKIIKMNPERYLDWVWFLEQRIHSYFGDLIDIHFFVIDIHFLSIDKADKKMYINLIKADK